MSNCTTCGKELQGRQLKYCSRKCQHKNPNHKSNDYAAQQKRGILRKTQAVLTKGGKCSNCGYDKNLSALCFHHIKGKDISLDIRTFSNNSIKYLQAEIDKCEILCHNCHMEFHHPEYENWKMVGEV